MLVSTPGEGTVSQTRNKIVVFGKEAMTFCEEVTLMFEQKLNLIHYFNKEVRGTAVTVLQILIDRYLYYTSGAAAEVHYSEVTSAHGKDIQCYSFGTECLEELG